MTTVTNFDKLVAHFQLQFNLQEFSHTKSHILLTSIENNHIAMRGLKARYADAMANTFAPALKTM